MGERKQKKKKKNRLLGIDHLWGEKGQKAGLLSGMIKTGRAGNGVWFELRLEGGERLSQADRWRQRERVQQRPRDGACRACLRNRKEAVATGINEGERTRRGHRRLDHAGPWLPLPGCGLLLNGARGSHLSGSVRRMWYACVSEDHSDTLLRTDYRRRARGEAWDQLGGYHRNPGERRW